jgi:hypothetical protein
MRYTDFRLLRREPIALDDWHKLEATSDYSRRQGEQRENRGVVREGGETARRNCDAKCFDCARSESEAANWSMNVQAEATIEAVGAYFEAKYTASRPAVSTVAAMGKCTTAACFVILNGGVVERKKDVSVNIKDLKSNDDRCAESRVPHHKIWLPSSAVISLTAPGQRTPHPVDREACRSSDRPKAVNSGTEFVSRSSWL